MTWRERVSGIAPDAVVEWFAAGNLAFLAADIYLAHAANRFAAKAEWIPVVFSLIAPLAMLPVLLRPSSRVGHRLALAVGFASIAVGVLGMVFHLESGFFEEQSIHQLVYTAPFVAPLSYVGLGLLVLVNRMEVRNSPVWAEWVLLLAFGGFVGNLLLSLLDHAQNGFFSPLEWTAVVAAAFGVSFLGLALWQRAPGYLRWCLGVMLLEAIVGLLGAALHFNGNLHASAGSFRDKMIYGAPVFAPMLFADLAILGAVSLWAHLRAVPAVQR